MDLLFLLSRIKKETIKDDKNYFGTAVQKLVQNQVLQWQPYDEHRQISEVQFYSEYQRNEDSFRSNDHYNEGPWHDWIMIRWKEDQPRAFQPNLKDDYFVWHGDSNHSYYHYCYSPSKIVGPFFQVNNEVEGDEFYALVWPCKYKYKESSVFTTKWEMEYKDSNRANSKEPAYDLVSCDSFVRHCLMIPEKLADGNKSTFYQEIWPRELWATKF